MKIIFFIRTLHGGGAQKIMIKLANAASENGYEVVVVTLNASGDFAELLNQRIRVVDLCVARMLLGFYKFSKVIRKERPDVILSTEVAVNIFTLISKWLSFVGSETKVIIREALSPSLAIKYNEYSSTKYGYRLARYFYPKADHVIAIAEAMRDDLQELCSVKPDKLSVININPCVDSRLLRLKDENPGHPWLLDATIPCIICVGRLTFQKGFDDAINAVININRHRLVRLIVVGDGEDREKLQLLINKYSAHDYIELHGQTKNPYSFMTNCDLFLMPSRYEGLGNVLIEALACGAKCVAYDCPVGPAETLMDGKFGWLVPVGDTVALEDAILKALDTPVDKHVNENRGLVYTAENSFSFYDRVIKRVVS